MCARTLWPFESSTRNMAFGRASTTLPSISMTPSFLAMSSAHCSARLCGDVAHPAEWPDGRDTAGRTPREAVPDPCGRGRTLDPWDRLTSLRHRTARREIPLGEGRGHG